MDKINACIVSYYMDNVNQKTLEMQSKVTQKFNKSEYQHYYIKGDVRPGAFMDFFWGMNGVEVHTMKGADIKQTLDFDVVLFLDIDAVPLNDKAIDLYIRKAAEGKLVGNIQRSNHINNNQHVFAAPSAVAISRETYKKIGCPTALETFRSDVAEEWTFEAEENGVPVELYLPLRFDRKPTECDSWALKDGQPHYGQGTTFGSEEDGELFYHNFQIFHPGQQENFWAKCEEILNSN